MKEEDEGWVYVPPTPGTFTVFPGKITPRPLEDNFKDSLLTASRGYDAVHDKLISAIHPA